MAINITSPVGRIVMGSLYNPNTKDAKGNLLVFKKGPDAGKPRVNYFFALAIPKAAGETHWNMTEWGKKIWALGHQCFPSIAANPAFAWKIEDGDSAVPNKKGNKPCDNEGWPGNWVIKFGGGFAPKIYRQEGKDWIIEQTPNYVKPGHYVEVAFSVEGNGDTENAGVYMNYNLIGFRAYGPEISFGPDVSEAGFGVSALPSGASVTPVASIAPLPVAAPVAMPIPVPIVPKPDFLMPKPKVMTALAGGATYDAFIAQGWTDEQLIAQGFMQP